MPTYEYVCSKCGYRFEKFQSIRAEPLRKCPSCAKAGLRRLIGGGAGLIFKGSGFYATDYRSEKYKEAAKKESPPASSGDSKSSSGKDSKPAAPKTESAPPKTGAAKA